MGKQTGKVFISPSRLSYIMSLFSSPEGDGFAPGIRWYFWDQYLWLASIEHRGMLVMEDVPDTKYTYIDGGMSTAITLLHTYTLDLQRSTKQILSQMTADEENPLKVQSAVAQVQLPDVALSLMTHPSIPLDKLINWAPALAAG